MSYTPSTEELLSKLTDTVDSRLSVLCGEVGGLQESLSFLADELHKIFEPIGNLHMSIADDIRKIADEIEEQGQNE